MKAPKAKKTLVPEGNHNVTCVYVADLGTQKSNNEKFSDRRILKPVFEFTDLSTKENVVLLSKDYTFSSSPKGNLMKDLKVWLGVTDRDYDVDNLLGKTAVVRIVHSEDGEYANIQSISEVQKGNKVKKPFTELASCYLDPSAYSAEDFESMPEWIQNKMVDSPEYDECTKKQKTSKGKTTAKAKGR